MKGNLISQGKLPVIYFDRVTFDKLVEDLLTDYKINNRKSLDKTQLSIEHLSVTSANRLGLEIYSEIG